MFANGIALYLWLAQKRAGGRDSEAEKLATIIGKVPGKFLGKKEIPEKAILMSYSELLGIPDISYNFDWARYKGSVVVPETMDLAPSKRDAASLFAVKGISDSNFKVAAGFFDYQQLYATLDFSDIKTHTYHKAYFNLVLFSLILLGQANVLANIGTRGSLTLKNQNLLISNFIKRTKLPYVAPRSKELNTLNSVTLLDYTNYFAELFGSFTKQYPNLKVANITDASTSVVKLIKYLKGGAQ